MITVGQMEGVEALRRKYGHRCASHSFLSLFIYQKAAGYELILFDDGFYAVDKNGDILFPVGSDEFKADVLKKSAGKRVICMRQQDAELAQSILPGFEPRRDQNRDEYVYDRAEQVSLEGHKFQKVRAKLSRFRRENNAHIRPLSRDNIQDAYGILSGWSPKAGEGDVDGALSALDNFDPLGLSGVVAYIDDRPVAYTCGGDIGGGVYMLCSAKQTCDAQGLDLFTKHELFKLLGGGIELINTESDHGSPGIRMHKNDQRPVFKNEMYEGILRMQ